jgi:2-polyprenyl-3-methyl-5-hydroxy-6-metoxy-1,4-benzoquinol methylase
VDGHFRDSAQPPTPPGRQTIAGLRVVWRDFPMPDPQPAGSVAGVAFGLWTVNDPDGLLDHMTQEEFERSDERMPYFGMIWAAGEALVAQVLGGASLGSDPALGGPSLSLKEARVLDLGCGLGPCGLAAASRGAHVTFFDWEPRALEIVAASARAQGDLAARCQFVVGDWRTPPPLGPFDRILGADVLYERRNGVAVAQFLAQHLAPGGEAWLTDPSRPAAQDFPATAQAAGLELVSADTSRSSPPEPAITFLRLRRPATSEPLP